MNDDVITFKMDTVPYEEVKRYLEHHIKTDEYMVQAFAVPRSIFQIELKERAIKAVEKQIPKKPIACYIGIETDAKALCCPVCHYQDECDFEDLYDRKYNYCPICGQALDRSEQ